MHPTKYTICSGQRIGELYFMAALPPGCILKSVAGLSCLPHHEVGLLEVQTGSGMDEEAERKVSQGRGDAFAHSTLLPGHHPLVMWGDLEKDFIRISDSKLSWQAYVLNLPIGHKITSVARDAVKLGDFKWKLNKLNKRRWKTWVSRSKWCTFSTSNPNSFLPAAKSIRRGSDNGHHWTFGCILDHNIRWGSRIFSLSWLLFYGRTVSFDSCI